MKKQILLTSIIGSMALISTAFIVKYSSGKTDSTGSPGEGTCGACHTGGSGTTMVSVMFNPSVSSGSYTPNQTYTVTVNVINNPYSHFGFACEILNSATLSNAGVMNNAGAGVQLLTGSNGRMVATHTAVKTGTGSAQFTFEWTAPSSGIVNVYAIGNAVNNNGATSGDKPSSTFSLSLAPDLTATPVHSYILSDIITYPNPVKDIVNVQFSSGTAVQDLKFSLVDLNGKIVLEQKVSDVYQGINNVSISLPNNIPSGLYLLKTTAKNQNITKIVLIQK